MAIETLRMARCDGKDCGALETMPDAVITGEGIEMAVAPKDWVISCSDPPKTYCPGCKYLY